MALLNKAPEGVVVLDLNAERVARAEQRARDGKGNPFLKLDAGYVELKAEFPITVAELFQALEIRAGLEVILADSTDVDALLEAGLSGQDIGAITKFVAGLTLGE